MKRRLVGAVVIVLLAIILVPAWLDGSARRLRDEDGFVVPLPPPDSRKTLVPVASIGAQLDADLPKLEPLQPVEVTQVEPVAQVVAPAPAAEVKPATEEAPVAVVPAKPVVKLPAVQAKKPVADTVPAPVVVDLNSGKAASGVAKPVVEVEVEVEVAESVEATANWIVQVGSFASRENAVAMVTRLKKGKLKAFMRDFNSNGDTIYRVLVGPFVRQTEADDAKRTIDRRFQVKSFVANWRG